MSGQDADIAKLERRYQREKQARQEAERLFEEASRSLFEANQQLSRQAEQLEKLVLERTAQLRHSLGKAEEAMFQAEAASRAKTDFLAVMSHEIRTPLNGVLGMAELLALTSLNSEQRENVSTLLECGQSLLSLINDILELCRIDAGKLEIQSQPFDLSASLHSLCKLFTPKAQEKNWP